MIKIFTFSFWCIFRVNNFLSSKFSGEGVGAMSYLLTNFWSRDSMFDGSSLYISRSPPYVRTKPGVGLLRNDDDLTAVAGWENDNTP